MRDHLNDVNRRVGLFATKQVSITNPVADGLAEIRVAMKRFRDVPPRELAATPSRWSRTSRAARAACSQATSSCSGSPTAAREYAPSRTEPKLKSYSEIRVEVAARARRRAPRGLAELAKLRDSH